VVAAVTAAASVEEAFTVAASVGAVFEEEAFTAVLPVEAFEVGVFAVVLTLLAFAADFVVMAFAEVAFVAVGSTIAASTMGSPSLVILVTRSFTTPVHTTGTIPIAIILAITLMVTDTVALAAAAFVAVAFMAVADPYNQSVYQGSAGYSGQLVGQIKLRVPRGTLLL
jgi:hypothetical protein